MTAAPRSNRSWRRDACGDRQRGVEIPGLDQVIAAKLLARRSPRTDRPSSVSCRRGRAPWSPLSVGCKPSPALNAALDMDWVNTPYFRRHSLRAGRVHLPARPAPMSSTRYCIFDSSSDRLDRRHPVDGAPARRHGPGNIFQTEIPEPAIRTAHSPGKPPFHPYFLKALGHIALTATVP